MNFGEYIKEIRKEKGLSMREVERRTSISQAYLSQIESGKRNVPKPEMIRELAKGIGVEYGELMQKAGYVSAEDEVKKSLKAGFGTGFLPWTSYEFKEEENDGRIQKILIGKGETYEPKYAAANEELSIRFGKIDPENESEILEFVSEYGELGRKHLPQKIKFKNGTFAENYEPETLEWIQLHIKTVKLVLDLSTCIKDSNESLMMKIIDQHSPTINEHQKVIRFGASSHMVERDYYAVSYSPKMLVIRLMRDILNENIQFVKREFTFSNERLESYFASDSLLGIIYWQLANAVQSEGVTGHS